jgi:hypothetical protein
MEVDQQKRSKKKVLTIQRKDIQPRRNIQAAKIEMSSINVEKGD